MLAQPISSRWSKNNKDSMKAIYAFKDKKITLLVVFLILFINITAYSQNTNDGGTTNTASTTLVEKEQKRKDSCELKAKPITSVSKETATNEQEDEKDWEDKEVSDLFFYLLLLITSYAIITGVYFRFCKLFGIELHWRVNHAIIGTITMLLAYMFLVYDSSGIDDVKLGKGIIYNKGKKVNDYLIDINYKGKIISKCVPKSIYWNVAIGDTVIFQISNGKLGFIHYDIAEIKKGNKKYVLHSKGTSRNLILMDEVSEQNIPEDKQSNNSGNQPEIKLFIPNYKQYTNNKQLLIDDLNSQVSLAENSKGHIYIEFSLSSPLMSANDIKILSGNKKVKDEFIEFINNLNNCGKIAESGKYVLYCEFDKGKIHKADLTKTD